MAGDLMMQPGHIPPVSFFVLQAIHSKTGCLCRSRTAKGKRVTYETGLESQKRAGESSVSF